MSKNPCDFPRFHLCWGAQAGLYYHYGLKKRQAFEENVCLFRMEVQNGKIPRSVIYDLFLHHIPAITEFHRDIHKLQGSDRTWQCQRAGVFLCMAWVGRQKSCEWDNPE